jgi:hypothetical protein
LFGTSTGNLLLSDESRKVQDDEEDGDHAIKGMNCPARIPDPFFRIPYRYSCFFIFAAEDSL